MVPPDQVLVAEDVLAGRVDMRVYPYRHLALYCYTKFRSDGVRQVLAAAEVLANHGWELINVGEFTGHHVYGFMRRLPPPPPTA